MTDIGLETGRADAPVARYAAVRHTEADFRDFVQLLKPRVMTLVVFTAFAGLILAPGDIHPVLACVAILCIAVGAGASGAINMWYDRDIDAVMRRTANRPIPAGRIDPESALAFGIILGGLSVMVMGVAINWTSAILLAVTIGFYVFIYTIWLKRRTPQNIVIGGAAGAFPPMIGWAAVTGDIGLGSIAMFALIFMWTPPHFWALSLFGAEDYRKANVPMLPIVAGDRTTRWHMLAYTVLLVPGAVAPYVLGVSGPIYGTIAGILSLAFIGYSVWVLLDVRVKAAKQMFTFSIFYLFALFTAMIMDPGLGTPIASLDAFL